MRKLLGYFLLIISCVAYTVIPIVPFLDLSVEQKAAWVAAIFIFAEITWWLAMPLLGKEIIEFCQRCWRQTKAWFRRGTGLKGSESNRSTDD